MEREDVVSIINGVFMIDARLGDIAGDLAVICELLEEDDGREDEEED